MLMNKRVPLGASFAFALIVAAIAVSITMVYARTQFNEKANALSERYVQYEKYYEIDRQVRNSYMGTIDETQLMDNVARGYLAGIGDEYGSYIDARTYERIQKRASGEIAGVGMAVQASGDGYLLVDEVYPDSPAEYGGIEAGDLIIKIDDTDLTLENNTQMMETIQGSQGSPITMVVRKGTGEIIVPMTRRQVTVPSVYSEVLEGNVGYVWIKAFNPNTADQFSREMKKLTDAGAQSLIFDVRDNSGEDFDSAYRVLDRLLPAGIIATATYKDGKTEVLDTSDSNEIILPMVVLANGGTASSAELFAQALWDYEKARIVGSTTMGKGAMQELFPLSDGSAIKVTVALFNPPSSENFNGVGVKPDYDVVMEADWKLVEREGDLQLAKAMEVAIAAQKVTEEEPTPTQQNQVESQPGSSPASQSQPEISQSSVDESSPENSESQESGEQSQDESALEQQSATADESSSSPAQPG